MKFLKTKILLLVLALASLQLSSCRDDLEVYTIERQGVFSFSTDNMNTQYASEFRFFQGKRTIHYYTPDQQEVYTRYLLRVTGKSTSGKNYTINIEFDSFNNTSFIGVWSPEYIRGIGGLSSVNYLEEVSPNVYKSYNLDPAFLGEDFFRVERQNEQEKLILGDFFVQLQKDLNPDDKLILYQGIFKDISYAL